MGEEFLKKAITMEDAAMIASFCYEHKEKDVETLITAFAEHKSATTFREQFLWYRKWFYETNGDRLRATIKRLKVEPIRIRKRMSIAEKWITKQNEMLEASGGAPVGEPAGESAGDPVDEPAGEPASEPASKSASKATSPTESTEFVDLPPFPNWAEDGDAIWSVLYHTIFDGYSRILIGSYLGEKNKSKGRKNK